VPKGAALIAGMLTMLLAVGGLAAGVVIWGGGGKTRGLVVGNRSQRAVIVSFEHGPTLTLQPDEQRTVPARREDYPQTVRVTAPDGTLLFERRLEYAEISALTFRLTIDDRGFMLTPVAVD
jgi:hypothetical protein